MLETVDMFDTQLTEQQMNRILNQSILNTNLKKLNMQGNGLVEDELRRQAKLAIKNLLIDNEDDNEHEDYFIEDGDSDDGEDVL